MNKAVNVSVSRWFQPRMCWREVQIGSAAQELMPPIVGFSPPKQRNAVKLLLPACVAWFSALPLPNKANVYTMASCLICCVLDITQVCTRIIYLLNIVQQEPLYGINPGASVKLRLIGHSLPPPGHELSNWHNSVFKCITGLKPELSCQKSHISETTTQKRY